MLKEELWTNCVFKGPPPRPYRSWAEFAAAPVKEGVTICATTAEEAEPDH